MMEIDFIVPWVDGNDPEWLEEKKQYDLTVDSSDGEINSVERFRDWDLMKYWFRGVETYAPWVRVIHFVTWGHVPSFLNVDHPKLHVVNHRDFIPKDCLPLYNASAIEVFLHQIPGLADRFVYFNDDMFLMNPVEESDFFNNGLPCGYFEDNPFCSYGCSTYDRQVFNALSVINRHFRKHEMIKAHFFKYFSQPFLSRSFFHTLMSSPWDKILGIPSSHMPAAFLKTTWDKVWAKEPKILSDTLHSKFRKSENVQQELFRYWQFMEGNFTPQKKIGKYFYLTDEAIDEACEIIRNCSYKEICLNDGPITNFEDAKRKIIEAFESSLPCKCSFEKKDC